MYGEIDARTQHFAAAVGIHANIAKIFTSRIPKKITKTTANGKSIILDGDTVIFSVLDALSELKGQLSFDSKVGKKIRDKYTTLVEKVKNDPTSTINVPCFERFVIEEFLTPYMPRAYKISFNELSSKEISALYTWIVF